MHADAVAAADVPVVLPAISVDNGEIRLDLVFKNETSDCGNG